MERQRRKTNNDMNIHPQSHNDTQLVTDYILTCMHVIMYGTVNIPVVQFCTLPNVFILYFLKVVDEYEFSGIIYNHAMSKIAIANSLVAVGNQSAKLRLIDLRSGSATHTLRGHQESVLSVEWSNKDEHVLASGG